MTLFQRLEKGLVYYINSTSFQHRKWSELRYNGGFHGYMTLKGKGHQHGKFAVISETVRDRAKESEFWTLTLSLLSNYKFRKFLIAVF